MRTLVRGRDFRDAVTVEVGEEDADTGTASLGHRKNETWPSRGADADTGVLKIDEMRQLRGNDHIEVPITVDIGDGGILRGGRVGAFGNRDVGPDVRVCRAEGHAHVTFGSGT